MSWIILFQRKAGGRYVSMSNNSGHGLAAYSKSLLWDSEQGLYVSSGTESGLVSYPEQGHRDCAELEGESAWFARRNQLILDVVRHWPPAGLFFDVGGGNGFVAAHLNANGWPTVLVEPGRDGCSKARDRGLARVVWSSFAGAGFMEGTLPAVGLFDVLEHLEDDAGFLRSVHSALRPEGMLYLTVPASPALWSLDDVHAGHFRRYSRKGLAALLRQTGFICKRIAPAFAVLFPLVFLLRALPSRLGLYRKTAERTARQHRRVGLLDWALAVEVWLAHRGLTPPLGTTLIAVAAKSP